MKIKLRRQMSKQVARQGGRVVLGRSASALVHAKKAPASCNTTIEVLPGGGTRRVAKPIYPLERHRGE